MPLGDPSRISASNVPSSPPSVIIRHYSLTTGEKTGNDSTSPSPASPESSKLVVMKSDHQKLLHKEKATTEILSKLDLSMRGSKLPCPGRVRHLVHEREDGVTDEKS